MKVLERVKKAVKSPDSPEKAVEWLEEGYDAYTDYRKSFGKGRYRVCSGLALAYREAFNNTMNSGLFTFKHDHETASNGVGECPACHDGSELLVVE